MMPVYNGAPYLRQAIESVLWQTHAKWELIILDDSSTDDSLRVIETFSDPRIRMLTNDANRGLAFGRTRCVREARGEFCAWLDQDDWSEPERFEKQVRYFRSHPESGICGSAVRVFGAADRLEVVPQDHASIAATFLFENPFANSSMMFRTSVFDGLDPLFSENYFPAEDFEVYSRLILKTRAHNLSEALTHYRVHLGQSSGREEQLLDAHKKVIDRIALLLVGSFSEGEQESHHRLALGPGTGDLQTLRKMDSWIRRLLRGNALHGVFEQSALESLLSQRWRSLCTPVIGNSFSVARCYWNGSALGAVGAGLFGRARQTLRMAFGPYKAALINRLGGRPV